MCLVRILFSALSFKQVSGRLVQTVLDLIWNSFCFLFCVIRYKIYSYLLKSVIKIVILNILVISRVLINFLLCKNTVFTITPIYLHIIISVNINRHLIYINNLENMRNRVLFLSFCVRNMFFICISFSCTSSGLKLSA